MATLEIPVHHRIYRKVVYMFRLWWLFPVAEHLTIWEKGRFDFDKINQIEGWLTQKEAIALFRIASRVGSDNKILEIGTWKGKSTYVLACGLDKNAKVITIDPFDASAPHDKASEKTYKKERGTQPIYEQFWTKMKKLGVSDSIKPLKGYSHDFVGKIPPIQALFIDGDHGKASVEQDIQDFTPILEKGGYLAFHDYQPKRPYFGVTSAVNAHIFGKNGYQFTGLYNSLCVFKKIQ